MDANADDDNHQIEVPNEIWDCIVQRWGEEEGRAKLAAWFEVEFFRRYGFEGSGTD